MKQKKFYTENSPWGSFTNLEETDDYKIKRIEVNPSSRLSLQMHEFREEYWTVAKGCGDVQINDQTFKATAGKMFHIPKRAKHRIKNTSSNNTLIFIEVQLGTQLREDDIIRYEDDYGRIENG